MDGRGVGEGEGEKKITCNLFENKCFRLSAHNETSSHVEYLETQKWNWLETTIIRSKSIFIFQAAWSVKNQTKKRLKLNLILLLVLIF